MGAPHTAALRNLRRGQLLELNGRVFKVTGYAPGATPDKPRYALLGGFGEDYELVVPQNGPAVFQPVLLPLSNMQHVKAVLIDGVAPKPPAKKASGRKTTKKATARKATARKRAPKKAPARSRERDEQARIDQLQAKARRKALAAFNAEAAKVEQKVRTNLATGEGDRIALMGEIAMLDQHMFKHGIYGSDEAQRLVSERRHRLSDALLAGTELPANPPKKATKRSTAKKVTKKSTAPKAAPDRSADTTQAMRLFDAAARKLDRDIKWLAETGEGDADKLLGAVVRLDDRTLKPEIRADRTASDEADQRTRALRAALAEARDAGRLVRQQARAAEIEKLDRQIRQPRSLSAHEQSHRREQEQTVMANHGLVRTEELSAGERFETTVGQSGTYNGVYTTNPVLHRVTWDAPHEGTMRGLVLGVTPVRRLAAPKPAKRKATTKKTAAKKRAKRRPKKTTTKRTASGGARTRQYKELADGRGGQTPGVFDDEGWTTGVPILHLEELAPGERFRFRGGTPWTYVGRSGKAHLVRNDQDEQSEFFGGSKVQLLGDDAAEERAAKLAAFEDKEQRRIDRLEERAGKKRAASDAAYTASREVIGHIPMGQPILVGHHSERRHRRDIERSRRNMDKSVKLRREAQSLERRAAAAASNATIRSDDPTAIQQLRDKIAAIEAEIERNKAINKAIGTPRRVRERTAKHEQRARTRLAELGYSEGTINRWLQPDDMGRLGLPAYVFSNARGRIKQAKDRIEGLQRDAVKESQRDKTYPSALGDVRVFQEDNRIKIHFPEKPHFDLRQQLGKRGAGFRWARSQGVWQRFPNDYAWQKANKLAQEYAANPPDYVETGEMERLNKSIAEQERKESRYRMAPEVIERERQRLQQLIDKAKERAS